MNPMTTACPLSILLVSAQLLTLAAEEPLYFAVQIVDEATGRGVPLVELETVNHLRFVSDSLGNVAINEPDLMGQVVYFSIRSHGYEFPKDGFGFRGQKLLLKPGGTARLKIARKNIAERLYRVTGSGIYRDSVLLKRDTPLDQPLWNADVVGCDSVNTCRYQGKDYWFWGDTLKPDYPIGGIFDVSGATTLPPQNQGLATDIGLNFHYFTDEQGSVRPMAIMEGDGPTWISSVTVLQGADGPERMYANYVKIRNQLDAYRWGFVIWNDTTQQFDEHVHFENRPNVFLDPQAHTFVLKDADVEYVYFANPLPLTRVAANPNSFTNPLHYEGFTCLVPGTRPEDGQLDRDQEGVLQFSWKKNTPPLSLKDQAMLLKSGLMKPEERLNILHDIDSGRTVQPHSGSVYWNEFRQSWLMITVELDGESSLLGEVWFAESDNPTGPWRYARKIVTHDKYSFYNPKHHPNFDEDGGRLIYFEGTYTNSFSGNLDPTPRYDYNQIMYRLDLAHSQLNLPVPFYPSRALNGQAPFATRAPGLPTFFALEHSAPGTVAIQWRDNKLQIGDGTSSTSGPVFHALPADAEQPPATTALLYELMNQTTQVRTYTIQPEANPPGFELNPVPICRVWK